MDILLNFVDIFIHIDEYLAQIINDYGTLTYLLLFVVIFMETGFVVTPFLPGDSLLFAAGALAATTILDPWIVVVLMSIAAVGGDFVNYHIGNWIGPRAYTGEIKLIKKEYIEKTHAFFEKHGGKTIFLARFVPIVRTFAPFVAGVGNMSYGYFFKYNFIGGITWVTAFTFLGYFFGELPFVQHNFEYVIIAIVLISVIPMIVEYINHKRAK